MPARPPLLALEPRFRFSRNARVPSRMSCGRRNESEQRRLEDLCLCRTASRGRWLTASRMNRAAIGALCGQLRGQRLAPRPSAPPPGTTLLTRPIRERFVRRDLPSGQQDLERDALADQPREPLRAREPGMMPRLISGCPNLAVSAAMRSVHAIASSQPPPSANPLMAAITGLPRCSIRSKTCWPRRACSLPSPASARELVDVGAGDERLVARAGHDHGADRRVVPQVGASRGRSSSVVGVSRALRTAGG